MRIGTFPWRAGHRAASVLVALALLASPARAGEFFEKDGAAVRGYDVVAYVKDGKAVRGTGEHTASYRGSTFRFASRANRDAFVADPARYAPQYGGFCAFGMAGGYKAATDPEAFSVVDGKLYLNYSRDVRKQWSADIPGYVAKADRNWPGVSQSDRIVQ